MAEINKEIGLEDAIGRIGMDRTVSGGNSSGSELDEKTGAGRKKEIEVVGDE